MLYDINKARELCKGKIRTRHLKHVEVINKEIEQDAVQGREWTMAYIHAHPYQNMEDVLKDATLLVEAYLQAGYEVEMRTGNEVVYIFLFWGEDYDTFMKHISDLGIWRD